MAAGGREGGCDSQGVVRPLSTSGVLEHAPIAKFEIQKLGNAISNIMGIKKSVVYDNFYWPMNTVFEEANVLD